MNFSSFFKQSSPATLASPRVLLIGAFSLYRQRFAQAMTILSYGVLGVAATSVVFVIVVVVAAVGTASPSPLLALLSLLVGGIFTVLAFLAVAVAQLWTMLALTVSFVAEQPITSARLAFRNSRALVFPYLWVVIATSALTGLLIFPPYFLLGVTTSALATVGVLLLFIPGVIASIWFVLGLLVLVVEQRRGLDVLLVSREYVRGRWWAMFYRIVVLALLAAVLSFIANIPSEVGLDAVARTINFVLQLLFTPVIIAYTMLLYRSIIAQTPSESIVIDRRLRRFMIVGLVLAGCVALVVFGIAFFI
ncbi:MAG: hypothetical protein WC052_05445 [Patescibacteria group bacterium]|jgi:hypothetical protein